MPQLRWILLLVGAAFIAALAWWELRRPRQAERDSEERRGAAADAALETALRREPALTLPEIRPRELPPALPVIEIAAEVDEIDELPLIDDSTTNPNQDLNPLPNEDLNASPGEGLEDEARAPEPQAPSPQWPPPDSRKILSLRIVAPDERFAGRALRQALASEGFLLGKMSIFHKADDDACTLVSAASLTQPGNFELETMDTQRFVGLNLFCVLPGPLPPAQALEALLSSARNLSGRLHGSVQDEHGEVLTAARIASLRDSVAKEAAAPLAAEPDP